MNNTDKIINALLSSKKEGGGNLDNDNLITSETLENELKAQQARIEKSFKDALKELTEKLTNNEKEIKDNGKDNFRKHEGSDGEQEVKVQNDGGSENDSN